MATGPLTGGLIAPMTQRAHFWKLAIISHRSKQRTQAMITIGIDPGAKGGLVSLDTSGKILLTTPMPGPHEVSATLEQHAGPGLGIVFLEHAQAMPKNGAVSMFTYGEHFGVLQGLLMARGYRWQLVRPQVWARELGVGGKGSKAAVKAPEVALRLAGAQGGMLTPPRCRKPHEGLVDAFLIAEWGRRQHVRSGRLLDVS